MRRFRGPRAVAAAVDGDVGAGGVGHAGGSQRSDEFGDLVRFAGPTKHGGHREVVEHFPFEFVGVRKGD